MRRLWVGGADPGAAPAALWCPLPSSAASSQAAVDAACEAAGGLDALVVDLHDEGALAEGAGADGVSRVLGAAFQVVRAALWDLSTATAPAITLILRGPPHSLEAHALHGGAHALCRSVAKEYGRMGLRCNCLVLEGAVPVAQRDAALAFLDAATFLTGETLPLCVPPPPSPSPALSLHEEDRSW